METTQASPPPRKKQALQARLFWFVAGAGVNYLLIATPFKWLGSHTELSLQARSAASMACSTLFFFGWNYFVNFRTDARKRDALARYLAAVALMYSLSSTLLWLLKRHDWRLHLALGGFPLDLDVVATQFFLAGIKFPLYHKWAFPVASTTALAEHPADAAEELVSR